MTRLLNILLFLLCLSFCYCQSPSDTKKKNYCNWPKDYKCSLDEDDPAHFDPYYNGHLCENFDPKQTDFSKEYYELRLKSYSKDTNKLQEYLKYNFSSIWTTGDWVQDGVLGLNYQRIQFHIEKVTRSAVNPEVYLVTGKSKVKDNICDFTGKIKLLKLFHNYYKYHDPHGDLLASYELFEDSAQNHSGVFKGITECTCVLDSLGEKMILDDFFDGADGYWNRSFVGAWVDYKTKQSKKCIWGDYRLPFTFDFDCGDGIMKVDDNYVKNGWESYNDRTEWNEDKLTNKIELKDKWWLK